MKFKFFLFIIINFQAIGILQSQDSIYTIIIKPDLKIEFPDQPKKEINGLTEKYEVEFKNQLFSIYSEPFPINYKGKTIVEAETEFYSKFTNKLISERKVDSITEKDTTFDGSNVRNLTFFEILPNGKKEFVFLKAIMAGGLEEALYIIMVRNHSASKQIGTTGRAFINSIDLYYNLENKLDSNDEKKNKEILKKAGFKIED